MDLVPNHTSDKHPWFVASVNETEPYTDYYVWKDGKIDPETGDRIPPNNWQSSFGGPAWTWCEKRNQYYLHHFLTEQPDLNYRNGRVKTEMEKVIEFWMELGVDGFRVDAINHLVEHESFADNTDDAERKDIDQPETYEIVKEWVNLATNFGKRRNKYIFFVTEAYSKPEFVLKYYKSGVSFPFNFSLISWNADTTSATLKTLIKNWMLRVPSGCWANWVISNHDQRRIANRLGGSKWTDVANMLLLLLPGTPTCYYGDELGMPDVEVSFAQCQDPFGKKLGPDKYSTKSRDPCRSPMLWDDTKNAGFTVADEAWLPIANDYERICVAKQQTSVGSHLNLFKQLLQLRQAPSFSSVGHNIHFVSPPDDGVQCPVLAFVRCYRKFQAYLIVLNVGLSGDTKQDTSDTVDLSGERWSRGKVVFKSGNLSDDVYANDEVIDLNRVTLRPAQGFVLALEENVVGRKRRLTQEDWEVDKVVKRGNSRKRVLSE